MTDGKTLDLNFKPDDVVELVMRAYGGSAVPTFAEVQATVESMLSGPLHSLKPHLEEIVNEVLKRLNVRIGSAAVLDDDTGHEVWLDSVDRKEWTLWPRYRGYLRDVEKLPPSVLTELDRSSDAALARLESPSRTGSWDRRGLVLGHVQSGKTTNYTALAAKAIDAGYRIVIILAGIHNSLRSQTHERIDSHLIGRDSTKSANDPENRKGFGVASYAVQRGLPEPPFSILTCTSALENGDFKASVAGQVWFQVDEGARLVMVVKKNATILERLHVWLTHLLGQGKEEVIHQPTLFIDDEADQASINIKDDDANPSVINGWVRLLLMKFMRVGFVGYTATPFANIFIDPTADFDKHKYGPDLFPRSFIVSLKAADDYIGPDLVFGHPGDESVGIPEKRALPMYVEVDDADQWVPPKHRKDQAPGALPESLAEAVRLFVLICSIRAARGDGDQHSSMLVHATRFNLVQNKIAFQVDEYLSTLRALLQNGSPKTLAEQELKFQDTWRTRLATPYDSFKNALGDRCAPMTQWGDVWSGVTGAIGRISVLRINGTSDDVLAYSRHPEGLWVIAIGGDKLSRGLTLYGLAVSYFLRTSRMFDTLMQMGRWFGYRPRYADLCRVYTTSDLFTAFREISLAVDDLRADLERMALSNRTPEQFGLRVRTPTDGMLITAANKIRKGEPVYVRFAGTLVQALSVAADSVAAAGNVTGLERLIRSLSPPMQEIRGKSTGWFIWSKVDVSRITNFLKSFTAFGTQSFLSNCAQLVRYIDECNARDELKHWTVCLVSKEKGESKQIAGLTFNPVTRKAESPVPLQQFTTRAVAGKAEEAADLCTSEFSAALAATRQRERKEQVPEGELSEWPDREEVRAARPPTRGLLLLYPIAHAPDGDPGYVVSAALSFPASPSAKALAYTANEVWQTEHGLEMEPI
jgi:Z1 domain